MSFQVDVLRRRGNGPVTDDDTISTFICDDTCCERRERAEFDQSMAPPGWFTMQDPTYRDRLYHACSNECRLRILAWIQLIGPDNGVA